MIPVEPTTPIAVTLQAQEWNLVLSTLGKAPYEVIAAPIQKITDQVLDAVGQRPPAPLVNGTAAHATD